MFHNVRCPLCHADQYKTVYLSKEELQQSPQVLNYDIADNVPKQPLRVVKCLVCTYVYANPQPTPDTLQQMYATMTTETYTQEQENRQKAANKVLDTIEKHKPSKGRILDIGCSTGILLQQAKERGWDPYGVELSEQAHSYATQTLKLPHIHNIDFLKADFENYFFDAIVLTDVIEHLPDPRKYIAKMKQLLHPDGCIYITTPNVRSWAHRLLKHKWWGIQLAHLHYFSAQTLQQMLASEGLKSIQTHYVARYFSVDYLIYRMKGVSPKFSHFLGKLPFIKTFGQRVLKISLRDQLGVIAKKNRSIESVIEREHFFEQLSSNKRQQDKPTIMAVLPAYNAAKTLERTVKDIPRDVVDEIILVDDCSTDNTADLAEQLGLTTIRHTTNTGYGGNQKTCYREALKRGADIVVMVHPDYQYDPKAIKDMVEPIIQKKASAVFGSRMMKGGALEGGMPLWKHNVNIMLTSTANIVFRTYLTEYHSGFRAFSRDLIENINLKANRDNFVFDFEMIAQIINKHYKIEEVPIKTRYFDEASSIKLGPAIVYGCGILWILLKYHAHKHWHIKSKLFD